MKIQLWQSKKKSWKWIIFEIHTLGKPFMFHFHRLPNNTQWFAYINVFPFAITKNNCYIKIGISLIKVFIGFTIHWDWQISKRKKQVKEIKIDLF